MHPFNNERPSPNSYHSQRGGRSIDFVIISIAAMMLALWLMGNVLVSFLPASPKKAMASNKKSNSSQTVKAASDPDAKGSMNLTNSNGLSDSNQDTSEGGYAVAEKSNSETTEPTSDSAFENQPTEGSSDLHDHENEIASNSVAAKKVPVEPAFTNSAPDSSLANNPPSLTNNEPVTSSTFGLGSQSETQTSAVENDNVENSSSFGSLSDPALSTTDDSKPVFGNPENEAIDFSSTASPTEPPAKEDSGSFNGLLGSNEETESGTIEVVEDIPLGNTNVATNQLTSPKNAFSIAPKTFPMRKWISNTGGVATMAFVRWDGESHIIFETEKKDQFGNPERYKVLFDRLSEDDQKYVLNFKPKNKIR